MVRRLLCVPVFASLPHVCCFDHKHRLNARIQTPVTRKPSVLCQTHLWAFGPVCCVYLKMAGERYTWHSACVFSLGLCLKTQEPEPAHLPCYSCLARPSTPSLSPGERASSCLPPSLCPRSRELSSVIQYSRNLWSMDFSSLWFYSPHGEEKQSVDYLNLPITCGTERSPSTNPPSIHPLGHCKLRHDLRALMPRQYNVCVLFN